MTASPPGENGVGQVYNRDVFCHAPFDWWDCCAVLRNPGEQFTQSNMVRDALLLQQKFESSFAPRTAAGLPSSVAFLLKSCPWAKQLGQKVLGFCRKHQHKELLAVLETPQTILIADWIGRNSNLKIHTLVWDHPEHIVASFGHLGWTRRRLLSVFYRCLKRSASIITVADSLRTYLQQHNPEVNCTSIRSPVLDRLPVAGSQKRNSSSFVIGMAGSVTAPEEFERLQCALDDCKWMVGGKKIVLRLFGFRFVLSAKSRRNVQYHGFLPTTSDVIESLAECDACFLPQPFDKSRQLVAEYSFPTKLSTYLAACRPVIVYAPKDASIPVFLRTKSDSPMNDLVITEAESGALLKALERLATDETFYESQVDGVRDLCETDFSATTCKALLETHFRTTSPVMS